MVMVIDIYVVIWSDIYIYIWSGRDGMGMDHGNVDGDGHVAALDFYICVHTYVRSAICILRT